MPKITFLQSRVVQDQHVGTDKQTRYEAGKTYELPLASCERWIRRGLARWADPEPAPAPQPEPEADPAAADTGEPQAGEPAGDPPAGEVDIPADWRDLTWQQQRSLAAKLTTDPVGNKAAAVAAIEAELERRAAASQEPQPTGDA